MNEKYIVKRTNHGEEYNRASMYETARETLIEGKKVNMNGKKHKTLFSVIMEDFEMELDKESKFLRQSGMHLKAKDDQKFIDSFSKTILKSNITNELQVRLERAVVDAKKLEEYNKYVDYICKKFSSVKNLAEMSTDELKYVLDILKEYESSLLFRINGDTVTQSTYKAYLITAKYIDKIENELKELEVLSCN